MTNLTVVERIHHLSVKRHHRTESATVGRYNKSSSTLLYLLFTLLLISRCESQPDNEDIQECHNNLYTADADEDGRVNSTEYVTFVKLEGPSGFLQDVDTFIDLPPPLQSNFFTLACLCTENSPDGDNECCLGGNAHLNTTGTGPTEIPTDDQIAYLDLVCVFTATAINITLEEQRTPSPTTEPSQTPTALPTAEGPTASPTDNSTDTMPPSPSPSSSPSSSPSNRTTKPTTTAPTTLSPTVAPSVVPIIVTTLYNIIVPNGRVEDIPQSSYTPDLISAMDVVSQDVVATLVIPGDDGRQRQLLRRGDPMADERFVIHHSDAETGRKIPNDGGDSYGVQQLRTNKVYYKEERERFRRKLEVIVTIPTSIEDIVDESFTDDPLLVDGVFVTGPCPNDLGDATTDLCQQVTASVLLELTGGEDAIDVYGAYLQSLNEALWNGAMGDALSDVAPDSVVSIATGEPSTGGPAPSTAPPVPSEDNSGLSTGAITGIAVGGAVMLLVVGYAAIKTGGEDPNKAKKRKRPYRSGDGPDAETLRAVPLSEKLELQEQAAKKRVSGEVDTAASTVTASPPDQKGQSNLGQSLQSELPYDAPPMEDEEPSLLLAAVPYISSSKSDEQHPEREVEFSNADELGTHNLTASGDARSTGGVSHESDAGWSETYTSSMGTVSDDEMLPDTPPRGNLTQPDVVMLAPTSALAGIPDSDDGGVASVDAKLEDLENAIIEGNWIAVGATAAALSKIQYDNQTKSDLSKSTEGGSRESSLLSDRWKGAIDEDKAAEMEHLIDSGDWEGIILAASRFENEKSSSTIDSSVRMITDGGSLQSDEMDNTVEIHEDNSEDEEEPSSPIPTSGHASEASRVAKLSRDEIRAQVLDLVKQVVPEEVDHVNEMIEQFQGREADLLETLFTMRARASAHQRSNEISEEGTGQNTP